jgi:hypothetical protein
VYTALFRSQPSVAHNAYKSGVYSFGLTLLALAKLEAPAKITNAGHDVDVISAEVGSCVYSDNFKQFLLEMLKTDEEERGDFVEFEAWLGTNPVSLPASSRDIKLQEKDRVLEQVSIRREEDNPVPPREKDNPVPPRQEEYPVLLRVSAPDMEAPPPKRKPKEATSDNCCTLL